MKSPGGCEMQIDRWHDGGIQEQFADEMKTYEIRKGCHLHFLTLLMFPIAVLASNSISDKLQSLQKSCKILQKVARFAGKK